MTVQNDNAPSQEADNGYAEGWADATEVGRHRSPEPEPKRRRFTRVHYDMLMVYLSCAGFFFALGIAVGHYR